jgi:hypothetical protein
MSTVVLLDSFTKASVIIEHEEDKMAFKKRGPEVPLPRARSPTRTDVHVHSLVRACVLNNLN